VDHESDIREVDDRVEAVPQKVPANGDVSSRRVYRKQIVSTRMQWLERSQLGRPTQTPGQHRDLGDPNIAQ
jgi:hypothetical protein